MEHSKQPFLKRLLSVRGMGAALTAFAGLIIIYIAFGLINPTVFSGRNIVNLTRSMSKYLIIGIGQSYLLITGNIDLSIGSVVGMSAMISGTLMSGGMHPIPAILVTLVACLLIVGVAVLFSLNVDSMVEYVGEQNELVVFMDVGTSDEQLAQMESQLGHVEGLGEIDFVSSDEAMQTIVDRYLDGDAGLLEGMDDDFMPASFRCQILDPENAAALKTQIEGLDNVDNVQAPTEITDTLVQLRHMINIFGGAIIVALTIVSLVIITNTIRASVFSRRKEISIMKYVGATNSFIRIPFIVEGVLLGLIAALIAFLGIWGGYSVCMEALSFESSAWLASLTQYMVPFEDLCYPILGGFLLAGILTGGIGSAFSMRKHLKV